MKPYIAILIINLDGKDEKEAIEDLKEKLEGKVWEWDEFKIEEDGLPY